MFNLKSPFLINGKLWKYSPITGYFYQVDKDNPDFDSTVIPYKSVDSLKTGRLDICDLPFNECAELFCDSDLIIETNSIHTGLNTDKKSIEFLSELNSIDFSGVDWTRECEEYPDVRCMITPQYHRVVRFSDWSYKIYNYCSDGGYVCHKEFKSYEEALQYGLIRSALKLHRLLLKHLELYAVLSSYQSGIETCPDKVSIDTLGVSIGDVLFELYTTDDLRVLERCTYKVVKVSKSKTVVRVYDMFENEWLSDKDQIFSLYPMGVTKRGWMDRSVDCKQFVFNCTSGVFLSEPCDISLFLDVSMVKSKLLEVEGEYPFLCSGF